MVEIERFDGTRASVINSAAPIFDAEGRVVGSAVAIQDISELRHAQHKVRESERLYRAIGESISYGVWVCAPDGRNLYASESFLNLVGLTQEQCSNFGWGEILHPEEREQTIAAWKECIRTRGLWDIEHRYRGTDGEWHPILARGVPVTNERGELLYWAGINLDISQLKKTEAKLREALAEAEASRRILDALMEYIPEGVTLAEAKEKRILLVSRFGRELLGGPHDGLTTEQVTQRWTVFQPDGQSALPSEELPLVRAMQKGETVRDCELLQLNGSGKTLTLLCNAAPIYNGGLYDMAGNVAEWVQDGFIYDRRAEEGAGATAVVVDPYQSPDEMQEPLARQKVLRGGSIFSPPAELRASHRDHREPEQSSSAWGFRCARTMGEESR
jgi:PAS domain S-box-containing protein